MSDCPKLSERLNWYGAYDFTNGECFIWEDGNCDRLKKCEFLGRLKAWRAGMPRLLGIEFVYLPGYSPALNPIVRMWGWMRGEVTRGYCHGSPAELREACQAFIGRIDLDPDVAVTRRWPKFDLDPEYDKKLRVEACTWIQPRHSRSMSQGSDHRIETLLVIG